MPEAATAIAETSVVTGASGFGATVLLYCYVANKRLATNSPICLPLCCGIAVRLHVVDCGVNGSNSPRVADKS